MGRQTLKNESGKRKGGLKTLPVILSSTSTRLPACTPDCDRICARESGRIFEIFSLFLQKEASHTETGQERWILYLRRYLFSLRLIHLAWGKAGRRISTKMMQRMQRMRNGTLLEVVVSYV
jgi:hypothetical protein